MRDSIRDDRRIESNVIRLFETQKLMVQSERASNAVPADDHASRHSRRDRSPSSPDEARRQEPGQLAIVRPSTERAATLRRQLEVLRATAASDRGRAAQDRARAAADRTKSALELARLKAALQSAHLDQLTGAYRREMGRLALANEIDRARRLDGQFVLAFIDIDQLKELNDRDGHAAGDRVLQMVVEAMRKRMRSFDPIVRFGGDEFLCGLGGADMVQAVQRFDLIGTSIQSEAGVGISVGLAPLGPGDTADLLIQRADAAMLEVKAAHHLAT
jgi:diguanylate cyclase (GGDEF)-like protein